MRTLIGGLVLAAVATFPADALSQRRAAAQPGRAQYEFGVDAGIAYYDPDVGDGGLRIGTPLDVRVGFVPRSGKLMWEPRLVFLLDTGGGEGTHVISPGVNVVNAVGTGTYRSGMFVTGGVALNMLDVGTASGTGFSLNGAVGWRKPSGSQALRYEVGLRWDGEIEDGGAIIVPSTISLGGRIGLSFWR